MSVRRPVVQVAARLNTANCTPAEAVTAARHAALNWLKKKQGVAVPDSAYEGTAFEIDAAEGQPVSVETSDRFWCMQFDRLSPDTPGRIWRTECLVAHTVTEALVGVRLAVIDATPGLDFEISLPRLVTDLINSPGLVDYGHPLRGAPNVVKTDDQMLDMIDLIEDPDRTRPVVVISHMDNGKLWADPVVAARTLAGLAHVYVIPKGAGWKLTEELGREFAVWGGAFRVYAPRFDKEIDESSKHPFYTSESLRASYGDHAGGIWRVMFSAFASSTVRSAQEEALVPTFREVKQAALKRSIERLASANGQRSEREQLLESQVALLKQQVEEQAGLAAIAETEFAQSLSELDQSRHQNFAMRTKMELLEQRLGPSQQAMVHPTSLDGLEAWVTENFPGRLQVLTRGYRAARKSPFNDTKLVYQCLERLARDYVDARRNGGPVENLFDDLGVHLERTGDAVHLRQWKNEYYFPLRQKSEFLAWHLKRGAEKNDITTMRIYFTYDAEDQQVIVGHLPGHLTNSKT